MKTAVAVSLSLAGALALGACAEPPNGGGPGLPPPPPGEDQCRASEYQHLIGQDRSRIPPQPPGANWRVTCHTCPVTMDYRADRLNIFYDQQTGVVREVRCG